MRAIGRDIGPPRRIPAPDQPRDADLITEVEAAGLTWLPITALHGQAAARLPTHHQDPFDRMLIAQARLDDLTVVTSDPIFRRYRVRVVW